MSARASLAVIILSLMAASPVGAISVHGPDEEVLRVRLRPLLSRIQLLHDVEIARLKNSIEEEKHGKVDPDERKISDLEGKLDAAQVQLSGLCQAMIGETIAAYGIKPNRYSAPIPRAEAKGLRANWQPKFGEIEHTHDVTLPDGSVMHFEDWKNYEAGTWRDGSTVITYAAFMRSPGYLAATIAHETVHFEQVTRDDSRMSERQHEMDAYRFMLDDRNAGPAFQLSPEEIAHITGLMEYALAHTNPAPFIDTRLSNVLFCGHETIRQPSAARGSSSPCHQPV